MITRLLRIPGKLFTSAIVLSILLSSCGDNSTDNTSGVDTTELEGSHFSAAVMNKNDSLTLMGWLIFDDVDGDAVHGRWCFESWGTQTDFPDFPVMTDGQFPEMNNLNSFTGTIHGDMVIVRLTMPGTSDTIGIVLDEQRGDEIFGTVSLLPEMSFKGTIKALRKQ